MESSIPDRYEQNPMLALIENYILDTLGKLDADKVVLLSQIICRTFGGTDWRQTLRDQFNLPPHTDEVLRTLWNQRQEESEATQQDLAPEDFARDQADKLFEEFGS